MTMTIAITALTNWLSPNTMHALGWTLLHFLWQGTALAALAAVLMALGRRASTRYALGVGTLALMLAAPAVTFFSIRNTTAVVSAGSYSESAHAFAKTPSTPATGNGTAIMPSSPKTVSLNVLPWLVEIWLLGVVFFSLRSAGGFLLIERERRRQSTPPNARILAMCHALQRQIGLDRTIEYCECLWLQAPAVIGWFRPIVLLPVTVLTGFSDEQLQSVIAHELAHIRRFDSFVNLFQIAIETLLFYHPAVWWLNRRIRAEREHCCDDMAVALCGNPVEYARALTIMEEWRGAPVLAMAANSGPLTERIFRLLGRESTSTATRGAGLAAGLLCLSAALIAGNLLLGIAYPKSAVHAGEDSVSQPSQSSGARLVQTAGSPQSSDTPVSPAKPAAKATPARPQSGEAQPASPTSYSGSQSGSYIEGLKAAGLDNLTVDQLVALKIQGVSPEYVRGMKENGIQPEVEHLIAMRIQGVSPEYVRDLRSIGLDPSADEIVAMKIQGVDPAYVRGMKENGIQPEANQIIALKIQGATPAYVHDLHDLGLYGNADHLVAMRIQGVTAEYVRAIQALGFKPTAEEFIAMRIQNVTPEYIRALQSAGLKFDIDDIVAAKIQDITPEFVEAARKHGFQNLTLQKLIELKLTGALDSRAEL
ncbi:MAG TPA: M56 family metallopeptidase [Terriglobales bacterium]|nr:M56 family metallopeptidase [Terriglobales bacterium]